MDIKPIVYTIGYSGFPSMDDFLHMLKVFHVRVLIDVRSAPYSTYYQQYDKPNIDAKLKNSGVVYRNYAHEFGARQEKKEFYKKGRLDFETFVKSKQFAEGVQKIDAAIKMGYTPVLMCAEKDPSTCHRAIMITRALYQQNYTIIHIMPDGTTKSQTDIEAELLECYYPNRNQLSLLEEYHSDEELIPQAYVKRNDEIGFREEEL